MELTAKVVVEDAANLKVTQYDTLISVAWLPVILFAVYSYPGRMFSRFNCEILGTRVVIC